MATLHNQPHKSIELFIFILLINPTGFVTGLDKVIGAPASRLSCKAQSPGCNDEKFVGVWGWGGWVLPYASDSGRKLIAEFPTPLSSWEPLEGGHVIIQALEQLYTQAVLAAQCPEGEHFQFPSLWDDTKINFSKKNSTRGIEGQSRESWQSPSGQRILLI